MDIRELEPRNVWGSFYDVTRVPRPSKREQKMVAFIEDFAKKNGLPYKKDEVGNIVIFKAASKGCENRRPLVLQSHIDMVCEKNADVEHDFDNDPIEAIIDGEWVRAKGTTLGADDGMGVACELAVLKDDSLMHGPIECLFTVDEETGLTGAMNIKEGFFTGKTLLNLDSEDEGMVFIGCAGGCSTQATFAMETEPVKDGMLGLKIKVTGLLGGHSGGDIHLERGNANKIMARLVEQAYEECGLRVSTFNGGNLRNALAREAVVTAVVPFAERENIRVLINCFAADIEEELKVTDPGFRLEMETTDEVREILSEKLQKRLIASLLACPHGVIGMSHTMANLVETSTNLASVKMDGKTIVIGTSQRSSVESAKRYVQKMVSSTFELAGADVECGEGYPGWNPNIESPILKLSQESYRKLFGKEVEVLAIHAGLECGLFLDKYPGLDMVSMGPTLRGVHSPDEKIEIKTVKMFWDYLVDVMATFDADKDK
ncbi:MAG: aminoacyl-histidine dipeptidase [Bacteroidales bacterium]|nr:aminoacyl-histidine dipeptidase [Bacteroidales bacterium]